MSERCRIQNGHADLFLLVTVLSQAFFTLVGGHLVAFSFLSAGHNAYALN